MFLKLTLTLTLILTLSKIAQSVVVPEMKAVQVTHTHIIYGKFSHYQG